MGLSDTASLKPQGHCLLFSVGSYPMVAEDCFGKLELMLWSEAFSFQQAALRYSKGWNNQFPPPNCRSVFPMLKQEEMVWTETSDTLEFATPQHSDEVRTFLMVMTHTELYSIDINLETIVENKLCGLRQIILKHHKICGHD